MPQHIDIHHEFATFFKDKNIYQAAYTVSQKLAEGHTCLDIAQYNKSCDKLTLEEQPKHINEEALLHNPWVSQDFNDPKPFILRNGKLYLHKYFRLETEIIDLIERFIKNEEHNKQDRLAHILRNKDFIQSLFDHHTYDEALESSENINWQLVAAISALLQNFAIITGGPGTGKTTTVAKILAILYTLKPNLKVALAAPTGKAAARMKESLMGAKEYISTLGVDINEKFELMEASTLHRLLGYIKNSVNFRYNAENPLNYDVVIIDESSMIGISMMAKLMSAVKPSSKIILLGDKDQLASVEAGSIFGDICLTQESSMNRFSCNQAEFINQFISSKQCELDDNFTQATQHNILNEHIVELKKSHRFKSNEGIGQFSKAIISGHIPDNIILRSRPANGEYVQLCENYDAKEFEELMHLFTHYINEKDTQIALQKLNKVRFLCAVKSGTYGVDSYNNKIERYLHQQGHITPNDTFYENQPIMVSQNDYNLNLFNGDIGLIRKDNEGKLKAWFDDSNGTIRSLNPGYINHFMTVFAMTIHKSQGSEFDHVGLILPSDDNLPLLTRELIYTGITRAKKSAVIFSTKEVLVKGTAKQVERASGITSRLLERTISKS